MAPNPQEFIELHERVVMVITAATAKVGDLPDEVVMLEVVTFLLRAGPVKPYDNEILFSYAAIIYHVTSWERIVKRLVDEP